MTDKTKEESTMKIKWTKRTPGTWKVCHAVIDKDDAERILSNNSANRKINNRQVAELVDAMDNGKWMLNGDTIVIDADGHLKSGQHRLTAFVKSNLAAIECLIVYMETREDVLISLNRGRPLTGAQYLTIKSVKNASRVNAIVKTLIAANRYLESELSSITDCYARFPCAQFRVEETYRKYARLVDMFANRSTPGSSRIPSRAAGIMCWMCIVFKQLEETIVSEYHKLANFDTPPGSMGHAIARVIEEAKFGGCCFDNAASKLVFAIVDYVIRGTEPPKLYATEIKLSIKRLASFMANRAEGGK